MEWLEQFLIGGGGEAACDTASPPHLAAQGAAPHVHEILAHDGLLAVRTDADEGDRDSQAVRNEAHVVLRVCGQLVPLAAAGGGSAPAGQILVDRLDVQRAAAMSRHVGGVGLESRGVLLLKQILAIADPASLMMLDGDFARASAILNIERILTHQFDVVDTGTSHRNTFVASSTCVELLVPVRLDDCFRTLPFDSKWEAWSEIRPLRILDHNSKELTFRLLDNKINFQKKDPDYCVIGIDVMALVMQYMHYAQAFGSAPEDISDYIHNYVLVPLHEDLETIWLRHLYYDTLSNRLPVSSGNSGDLYHGIPTDVGQAVDSLLAQIPAIEAGTITPDVVLSALPVVNQRSVAGYLHYLEEQCTIPERRQYWVYHYLTMMPWFKLIVLTYRLNRDYVQTTNLQIVLRRDLDILKGYAFTGNIHNGAVKQLIDRDVALTFDWLING